MDWKKVTGPEVRQDNGEPCCACCLSTVDIEQVKIGLGNFTAYLCPECRGATFKYAPRPGEWPFGNAIVTWIECPTHGKRIPRDVVEKSIDFIGGGSYPVKGRSGANLWGLVDYKEI